MDEWYFGKCEKCGQLTYCQEVELITDDKEEDIIICEDCLIKIIEENQLNLD